jgi:hypothetical protein
MKKVTIYQLSLWIGICFFITGFYLRKSGNNTGDFLFGSGSIFVLIILILGLKDVFSNEKIKLNERIMWLIGFVFILPVAGILYFPTFRKRN